MTTMRQAKRARPAYRHEKKETGQAPSPLEPICTCPDLETTEIHPCALHDLGADNDEVVQTVPPPVLSMTRAEAREAASELILDLAEHCDDRQPVVDLLIDLVLREGVRVAGAIALVALEIVFAECMTPVPNTYPEETDPNDH